MLTLSSCRLKEPPGIFTISTRFFSTGGGGFSGLVFSGRVNVQDGMSPAEKFDFVKSPVRAGFALSDFLDTTRKPML